MSKSSYLTRQQAAVLTVWLSKNEENVKTMPDSALAAEATKEIGFPVSTGNITGARKALYPDLDRSNGGSPLSTFIISANRRMDALEARIKTLETGLGV